MTSLTGAIWSVGAEDHPLRPGDRRGTVAGADPEGVSGLEHLHVVGEGERDASPDDVPPVLAGAQVVRAAPGGAVPCRVLPEVQDGDLVAVHDSARRRLPRRCPSSRRSPSTPWSSRSPSLLLDGPPASARRGVRLMRRLPHLRRVCVDGPNRTCPLRRTLSAGRFEICQLRQGVVWPQAAPSCRDVLACCRDNLRASPLRRNSAPAPTPISAMAPPSTSGAYAPCRNASPGTTVDVREKASNGSDSAQPRSTSTAMTRPAARPADGYRTEPTTAANIKTPPTTNPVRAFAGSCKTLTVTQLKSPNTTPATQPRRTGASERRMDALVMTLHPSAHTPQPSCDVEPSMYERPLHAPPVLHRWPLLLEQTFQKVNVTV